MNKTRVTVTHTLLLVLAALIWGFAFVSQSVGAEYVGAFTFTAIRNWIAVVVLLPVVFFLDRRKAGSEPDVYVIGSAEGYIRTGSLGGREAGTSDGFEGSPRSGRKQDRRTLLIGGVVCGIALCAASTVQQIGMAYTTTARASFITAMYMVLVPVFSIFLGRAPAKKVWVGISLGVIGLYLLCLKGGEGLGTVGPGDLLMLGCAALFAIQILCINHYVSLVDGVKLSFFEMLVTAIISTVPMLLIDHPTSAELMPALTSILYAGVMSSGVAFTLQTVAQENLDPAIASLAMCLESVFGALGGWMLLGQTLTARELFGCALMFLAIIICELPESVLSKRKSS